MPDTNPMGSNAASTVNVAMLTASFTTQDRLNLHGTIDHRRSPLLGTSNAIIGQGVESLEELSAIFTEDELRALAEDNTAVSDSANLGVSLPLSERFQLSADVYYNRLETAANFADLTSGRGETTSLGLGAQLVASSWWRQSDAWILGMRYTDSDTFRTTSVSANSRIPLSRHFRINPILMVSHRRNLIADSDEWILRPGLRADVRWRRRFVIELEVRGETADLRSELRDSDRSSYYFSLGYRADFGR